MKPNKKLALIAALIIASSQCATSVGAMNQVPQNVAQIEQDQLIVNGDFDKKCEILDRLKKLLNREPNKPYPFWSDDVDRIRNLITDYQAGNINVIEEINHFITRPHESPRGGVFLSLTKTENEDMIAFLVDYANTFLDQIRAENFIKSIDEYGSSLFYTTLKCADILLDGIQTIPEKINFIMYKNQSERTAFDQFHYNKNMLEFFINYLIRKCQWSTEDVIEFIKQKNNPTQKTMLHDMLKTNDYLEDVISGGIFVDLNYTSYKHNKSNAKILINQFESAMDQFKFVMMKDQDGNTAYDFKQIKNCVADEGHNIKEHPFLIDTHKEFGTLMFSALVLGSSDQPVTYEQLDNFLKLVFDNNIGIKMFKNPEEVLSYVNELNNLNKLNLPEDMLNKAIEFESKVYLSNEGAQIIGNQENETITHAKYSVILGTFGMNKLSEAFNNNIRKKEDLNKNLKYVKLINKHNKKIANKLLEATNGLKDLIAYMIENDSKQ